MTRRNGQTLILINRAETGLDSIRCDDRDGARQAFEALRGTGASRFAVVTMADPSPSLLARERAFARFVAESGAHNNSRPCRPTRLCGRAGGGAPAAGGRASAGGFVLRQ